MTIATPRYLGPVLSLFIALSGITVQLARVEEVEEGGEGTGTDHESASRTKSFPFSSFSVLMVVEALKWIVSLALLILAFQKERRSIRRKLLRRNTDQNQHQGYHHVSFTLAWARLLCANSAAERHEAWSSIAAIARDFWMFIRFGREAEDEEQDDEKDITIFQTRQGEHGAHTAAAVSPASPDAPFRAVGLRRGLSAAFDRNHSPSHDVAFFRSLYYPQPHSSSGPAGTDGSLAVNNSLHLEVVVDNHNDNGANGGLHSGHHHHVEHARRDVVFLDGVAPSTKTRARNGTGGGTDINEFGDTAIPAELSGGGDSSTVVPATAPRIPNTTDSKGTYSSNSRSGGGSAATSASASSALSVHSDSFWKKNVRFAVPAFFYVFSNNAGFFVLRHMSAVDMAMLSNLRIVIVAVMFRFALKRYLTLYQWIAVTMLLVSATTAKSSCGDTSEDSWTGLIVLMLVLFVSAAADIVVEHVFKSGMSDSIHFQNIQLYTYGILFNLIARAIVGTVQSDSSEFFAGWSFITFVIVAVHATTGLLIAAVLKLGDNMLKLFADAAALILTFVFSIVLFGTSLSITSACGAVGVICAVMLYQLEKIRVNREAAELAARS